MVGSLCPKYAAIGVKQHIAKTICAFLNSNGGVLFIGVNDNGIPTGLDYDFSLSGDKDEKDFFQLEFDQTLTHFFSKSILSFITAEFHELNSKTIFVVQVSPSIRMPIFMKGRYQKEFYVRGQASSLILDDVEEIVRYCLEKWNR